MFRLVHFPSLSGMAVTTRSALATLILSALFFLFGFGSSFIAEAYTGATGIIFENSNATGYDDVKVTCPPSGVNINFINTVTQATGGAHSCTGNETFYVQGNVGSPAGGTLPDGDYCWYTNGQSTSTCPHGEFSFSNGAIVTDFQFNQVSPFSSVYNSRILDVSVTKSGTVAGIVGVNFEAYVDPNEYDPTLSSQNPTSVKTTVVKFPSSVQSSLAAFINPSIGTSTGTIVHPALPDGTYEVLTQFNNAGCTIGLSPCPFPSSYVYTTFTVAVGGTIITTVSSEYYDARVASDPYEKKNCSLANISGCISNSFAFLFVPDESNLTSFTDLNASLQSKFPFAYAYDFKDSIVSFYTGTQTETITVAVAFGSFGNIELMSASLLNSVPFAATIRLILGYLIWVMFMGQMYRRTLMIFNRDTTS